MVVCGESLGYIFPKPWYCPTCVTHAMGFPFLPLPGPRPLPVTLPFAQPLRLSTNRAQAAGCQFTTARTVPKGTNQKKDQAIDTPPRRRRRRGPGH